MPDTLNQDRLREEIARMIGDALRQAPSDSLSFSNRAAEREWLVWEYSDRILALLASERAKAVMVVADLIAELMRRDVIVARAAESDAPISRAVEWVRDFRALPHGPIEGQDAAEDDATGGHSPTGGMTP